MRSGERLLINRMQALVLGFFGFVWIALVAILLLAPEIYDVSFRLEGSDPALARVGFLSAISLLIALLVVGALRRWRWTFWLILVAFLAGGLRIPATALELAGVIPVQGPTWYLLLQAMLGAVQLAVGVLMFRGYRRAGTWAAF